MIMSRKKPTARETFVMFNVTYEDGLVTSNRKVSGTLLGGLEGDAPAQTEIEAQDQRIAEQSGRSRGPIKLIERAEAR